jgi:hypothetical protein
MTVNYFRYGLVGAFGYDKNEMHKAIQEVMIQMSILPKDSLLIQGHVNLGASFQDCIPNRPTINASANLGFGNCKPSQSFYIYSTWRF